MMDCKICGRVRLWHNLRYYPRIGPERHLNPFRFITYCPPNAILMQYELLSTLLNKPYINKSQMYAFLSSALDGRVVSFTPWPPNSGGKKPPVSARQETGQGTESACRKTQGPYKHKNMTYEDPSAMQWCVVQYISTGVSQECASSIFMVDEYLILSQILQKKVILVFLRKIMRHLNYFTLLVNP